MTQEWLVCAVRFFKSNDMKGRLASYTNDFSTCRADIDNVLQVHTAVQVVDIGGKMDHVMSILETIGRDSKREVEASRLVEMRQGREKVLEVGIHMLGRRYSMSLLILWRFRTPSGWTRWPRN